MATPSRPAPQATNGIYTPEHARQHTRAQSSFRGCSRISDYEVMGKIGEGTFGEVHKAKSKKTGMVVALKKILMINEKDGFPITALREIKTLKLLSHENVLSLEEMAVEHPQKNTDKKKKAIMYMVTPYFDHDLSGLLKNPNIHFTEPQIKCYMLQLLKGMEFIHNNNILHRDIKAANILINNKGILQIADFGLARHYNEPVPVAGKGNGEAKAHYTVVVVTRWYRPPELFLELQNYTPAIDIWGVGCVFGEMFLGKPILQGESEEQQLKLIFDLCGTPNEENMPGWRLLPKAQGLNFSPPRPSTLAQKFREQGSGAISLLQELLKLDWKKRTNAIDALKHPYFKNSPFPLEPHDIPILESSHEFDSKQHRGQKQAPPPPKGGDVGMGPDQWDRNGSGQGYDNYSSNRSHQNGRYPPPPPHGGYRNSGPPHQQYDDRKPGWRRDDRGLPPRPPPPTDFAFDGGRSDSHGHRSRSQDLDGRGHRDRDHASLPRSRAGGGGGNIDTYIPSYNTNRRPREDRPPRDDRPLPRDDRRDDRPRHSNGTRHDYDNRGSREPRDSRSRSPNHDRGRDRYRDREPIGDPYAHRR